MPVQVTVDAPWQKQVPRARLVQAAVTTLQQVGLQPEQVALSIHIADTPLVHELNRRYRGQDKPTDVLSFQADEVEPETELRYLGDVVIAYPVAAKQAQQAGHSPVDELTLLTVHGVLHLLGYDDETPAARRQMWAVQEAILDALQCPARPPL